MAASPAARVLLFELVDAAVVVDPADISRADDPGNAPRRPVDADPAALGSHVEGFTFDAYNGPIGGVGDVDYLILFADSECDAARGHPRQRPQPVSCDHGSGVEGGPEVAAAAAPAPAASAAAA